MSPFEHVTVLISIVLGVAVTQLLAHLHALAIVRHRVRSFWLSWLWAALLFVTTVAWWWGAFALRTMERWNFFIMLLLLVSPVLLFLAAAFVLPDPPADTEETIDLRAHYWRTHSWFFGLLATSVLVDAGRRVLLGEAIDSVGTLSNLAGAAAVAVLAKTRVLAVHVVLSLVSAALLGWYVVSAALELRA